MKRVLLPLLCLALLLSAFPAAADLSPSFAVITVDGVRAAFFSDDGAYLPLMEENGVVYAPVLSLAESLNLTVTADAKTLAVTVSGVRTAFFDEQGAFLPPLSVDGTVYVPLAAFAQSAGLDCSADGGAYAFKRQADASQRVQAAALPTAQPDDGNQYIQMPLTRNNYKRYFSLSQDFSKPSGTPNPYYITYTATIYATTGYDLINVQFDLEDYGTVRMPASGKATVSCQSEPVYAFHGSFTDEALRQILALQGAASLKCALPPSVLAVSGAVRMTKAEAEAINEEDYIQALKGILLASRSSDYTIPIEALERLARMNYKDSAQRAKDARQKRTELLAAEKQAAQEAEEKKNEQDYQKAEQLLASRDYDQAITILTALADKHYLDSTEKLTLAQKGKAAQEAEREKADAYQSALDALAGGDYQTAMDLFAALAEAGYRDSAEQLIRTQKEESDAAAKQQTEEENKRREALYQKGLEAINVRDTAAAIAVYQELAALDYLDSAEKLSQVKSTAYETALSALTKGDYDAAISLLELLAQAEYRDSAALLENARQDADMLERIIALHEAGKSAEGQKLLEANRQLPGLQNAYERWRFRRAYQVSAPNSLGNVWVQYEKKAQGKEEIYTLISPAGKRLAEVIGGKEKSYYDDAGNRITAKQYDSYCQFFDFDYALVTKNKTSYLLDREGNETALSSKRQYTKVASNRLLIFQDEKGRYGYTDFSGKVVVKAAYASATRFVDGYATVTQKDKKGNQQAAVIDEKGKQIIPFGTYENISVISANLFRALKKGDSVNYWLDAKGKVLQKTDPFIVISLTPQYLTKLSDGKKGLINADFRQVLPCQYKDVTQVIQNQRILAVSKSGAVLLDMDGNELTAPGLYSSFTAGSDSAAIAARGADDHGWYILDLDGNILY